MVEVHQMKDVVDVVNHYRVNQSHSNWVISFDAAVVVVAAVGFVVEADVGHFVDPCIDRRMIYEAKPCKK